MVQVQVLVLGLVLEYLLVLVQYLYSFYTLLTQVPLYTVLVQVQLPVLLLKEYLYSTVLEPILVQVQVQLQYR